MMKLLDCIAKTAASTSCGLEIEVLLLWSKSVCDKLLAIVLIALFGVIDSVGRFVNVKSK
jgi:hypothetical protein